MADISNFQQRDTVITTFQMIQVAIGSLESLEDSGESDTNGGKITNGMWKIFRDIYINRQTLILL